MAQSKTSWSAILQLAAMIMKHEGCCADCTKADVLRHAAARLMRPCSETAIKLSKTTSYQPVGS